MQSAAFGLFRKTIIILFSLFLIACQDSSTPEPEIEEPPPPPPIVLTGSFVDSSVQGIYFSTDSQSGITNELGQFQYLEGESITFILGTESGSLVLPEVFAKSIITPLDFVDFENDQADTIGVTQVLRLLQTLDSDQDPSNGIFLSDAALSALDASGLNWEDVIAGNLSESEAITSILTELELTELVSVQEAIEHFQSTLNGTGISTEDGECEGIACPYGDVCYGGSCYKVCAEDDLTNPASVCFESCPEGSILLLGQCVEQNTADPLCDEIVCPLDSTCYEGSCFPACNAVSLQDSRSVCSQPCPEGTALQDGYCVAIDTDACTNIACPLGQTCYAGSCYPVCDSNDEMSWCYEPEDGACASIICPYGETCYDGSCYFECDEYSKTNPLSICFTGCPEGQIVSEDGVCVPEDLCENITCPIDQVCYEGSCYPIECPEGQVLEDGICVDEDLCKNITCPVDQVCYEGSCYPIECPEGQVLVDGICVDEEPNLCTGIDCAAGKFCFAGECYDECPEGQYFENGQCLNPQVGVLYENDPNFNGSGELLNSDYSGFRIKTAVQDTVGNIYVGGYETSMEPAPGIIWKLDIEGNTIDSFGVDGLKVISHPTVETYVRSMVVDAEGYLYAVGNGYDQELAALSDDESSGYAILWKFAPDGTLDTTFANNGQFAAGYNTAYKDYVWNKFTDIAITPQGDLLAFGDLNGNQIVVAKLTTDGELVDSFGEDGLAHFKFQEDNSLVPSSGEAGKGVLYARTMSLDDAGNIHLLGMSASLNGEDRVPFVVKLNATGELDTSFSGDGSLLLDWDSDENVATRDSRPVDILVENNTVHVLGEANDQPLTVRKSGVTQNEKIATTWKINATNGALDDTFGDNGNVVYGCSAGGPEQEEAKNLFLDSAGNVIFSGYGDNGTVIGSRVRQGFLRSVITDNADVINSCRKIFVDGYDGYSNPVKATNAEHEFVYYAFTGIDGKIYAVGTGYTTSEAFVLRLR